MRKCVISGGACAGKTTLVNALSARGHFVLPEIALELIEQEADCGGKVFPWTDFERFQERCYREQQSKEHELPADQDVVFLDRSLIDSVAYYRSRELPLPDELRVAISGSDYSCAFILDILPEEHWAITHNGKPRMQSYATAVEMHKRILDTYLSYSIPVFRIPVTSVDERVDAVMRIVAELGTQGMALHGR